MLITLQMGTAETVDVLEGHPQGKDCGHSLVARGDTWIAVAFT